MIYNGRLDQILIHQLLMIAYLWYLCRPNVFSCQRAKYVEIFCEAIGMFLTALIMQYARNDLNSSQD